VIRGDFGSTFNFNGSIDRRQKHRRRPAITLRAQTTCPPYSMFLQSDRFSPLKPPLRSEVSSHCQLQVEYFTIKSIILPSIDNLSNNRDRQISALVVFCP
jgi:hypothetical protein